MFNGKALEVSACWEQTVIAFVVAQRQTKAGGDGGSVNTGKEAFDADAGIKGVSTGVDLDALKFVGEE